MNDTRLRVKIETAIERIFRINNEEFFSYAWRENVKNFLTAENKYTQLLEWINERLETEFTIINCFNPADKNEAYTNGQMKDYSESCKNVAILINAKTIIMDEKCTTQMRENWEYTLCKLFNIKYNEELGYTPK